MSVGASCSASTAATTQQPQLECSYRDGTASNGEVAPLPGACGSRAHGAARKVPSPDPIEDADVGGPTAAIAGSHCHRQLGRRRGPTLGGEPRSRLGLGRWALVSRLARGAPLALSANMARAQSELESLRARCAGKVGPGVRRVHPRGRRPLSGASQSSAARTEAPLGLIWPFPVPLYRRHFDRRRVVEL